MKIQVLTITSRSAALELINDSCFYSPESYQVCLNGITVLCEQKTNVFSLFQLKPDTEYRGEVSVGEEKAEFVFRTKGETAFINAARYGLKGDGVTEDTQKLQAAILTCPPGGTVYVPEGTYLCQSLFLKSDVTLYLDKGCTILGKPEREGYPILPGVIPTTDESKEYYLGSWEGNPLDSFAGLINVIESKNVVITGQGVIDANAYAGDWYINAKVKRIAWRPRLFFTCRSEQVTLHGVTVKNSYSWTIHPTFSKNLDILDITIHNADNSPNTDGIDPECCENVRIIGDKIHVGDDCIALKAGKLFIGKTMQMPCRNVEIRNCLLSRGHGGLVIGSEMSGGAVNVTLTQCLMDHTDRGLRIKTRRGRGKYAVIDGLTFRNVEMDSVLTPFVVNMFYCCDPDGTSDYVQCREPLPVDDRTPKLGELTFEEIRATGAQYAGCWFSGLPEQPIAKITMKNVNISFDPEAKEGEPAMTCGETYTKKLAFRAENVASIHLENVTLEGYEGERLILNHVPDFKED